MKQYKTFIGIDQSLASTGICVLSENAIEYINHIPTTTDMLKMYSQYPLDITKTKAYKSGLIDDSIKRTKKLKDYTKEELKLLKIHNQKRMFVILDEIQKIFDVYKSDDIIVGLEGISFHGVGKIDGLARLLGGIEALCRFNHIKHIVYEPTTIKMFAGKGNFKKEDMENAVPKEDLEYIKSTLSLNKKGNIDSLDDIIDAYWIAKLLKSQFR